MFVFYLKQTMKIILFVYFYLFCGQNRRMMNTIGVSDVDIMDITSSDAKRQDSAICLEQNGFLLCKRGNISLMMDDHTYHVHEGDLYIYPAFSQTYIRGFSEDLQGVVGKADFDFVLSSLDSIADTQSHVYIRFHPLVSLTPLQYRCIDRLIEGIRNRKEISTRLGEQVVSALVQAFCYEVIDAYISNCKDVIQSKKQTRKDKIFQNFLISLHKGFRMYRDVGYYAAQQSLTPRYFTTLVHGVSGKTPSQWISLFVISEAKRLLSNPKNSIKEVAVQLNFTEQSFFGRYFKQHVGCSPSEYKMHVRKRDSSSGALSAVSASGQDC